MTASRPIDERIRFLCTVLNSGPKGIEELRAVMPYVERSNLWKYCSRAVVLGVVKVGTKDGRKVFSVTQNWQEIIEARNPVVKPAPVKPIAAKYKGPILTRWVGPMSHLNEVRV